VDRKGQPRAVTVGGLVALPSLHHIPAVVPTTGPACHFAVDLLSAVLPHVPDPEIAGAPVEAEAPRIPQTVGPDLVAGGRVPDEGVVVRNGVGLPSVHVQTKYGAQERPEVLAVPLRITSASTVAERDIQVAVRAESDLAAVVVRVGLVDGEEDHLRVGVGHVRILRDGEAADPCVAGGVRVVHEDLPVGGVLGMKGECEEPALAACAHPVPQVQERRGGHRGGVHHPGDPRLLNHEERRTLPGSGGEMYGSREAVGDKGELDRALGGIGVFVRAGRPVGITTSGNEQQGRHEGSRADENDRPSLTGG